MTGRKATGSSGGRRKRRPLGSVDRISNLPDPILGIILSFLPTKDAVSTSVLSKRWKLPWTLVDNLDFCHEGSLGKQKNKDNKRFIGFVEHVLLHHDSGWLNKFRLVWTPKCISSYATSWINTAISKDVHELFLRLETTIAKRLCLSPVPFVMPISVFSCDTLRILELDGGIFISESIVVRLPKLETITLGSIQFQSEGAFEKLIRGCPMLINLNITMQEDKLLEFSCDVDFKYIIYSTYLRRLEVDIQYPLEPLCINFVLETPSLEYLSLDGFIPAFPENTSLSSLVEAKLHAELGDMNFKDVIMCNSVVEAVRMFNCAKSLNFSQHIFWALSCASDRLSTEFKRLVKLEADSYSCACSSIRDFMECSDNLEILSVYQYEYEYEYDSGSGDINLDLSKWIAPVQVPRCLSYSLKKIVLQVYDNLDNEREMVQYMLQHGKALEGIEISFDGGFDNSQLMLIQEIYERSKKLSSNAPACEVKFAGGTDNRFSIGVS